MFKTPAQPRLPVQYSTKIEVIKRQLRQKMQMSFGTLDLAERLKRENVLMKIDALIEWGELRPKLRGLYRRELFHGGGQEPFLAMAYNLKRLPKLFAERQMIAKI